MDHVERARAAGRSIALFHWKRYEADPVAPLDARIRQLAFDGKARIVSPGEEVRTRLLLIGSPSVTSHLIDLPPRIEFARLLVLDDGRGPANPQAEANLQQTFAEAGERIAAARVDYHTLHEADPPDAAASKME